MSVQLTPEARSRLLRAIAASAATGAAIYLLVMNWALPTLRTRLTASQVEWLRRAFQEHPWAVLATILAVVATLGLPVIGMFRLVYGRLNS